jgi:hemoglobin
VIRHFLRSAVLIPFLLLPASAVADHHGADTEPTVREQLLALEERCAENASAMKARQAEASLYERLGGREGIHAITREIVRLHDQNEALTRIMDGVDRELLARRVAQFIISGTGGPQVYEGRDLVSAHAHLDLTNAHFLAAGGDVMQAMENEGCTEDEIQEIVCILVSLRHKVVMESARELR